jgi:hypothetical protein
MKEKLETYEEELGKIGENLENYKGKMDEISSKLEEYTGVIREYIQYLPQRLREEFKRKIENHKKFSHGKS